MAMEDGVRDGEQGRRAEMAEAMPLPKQVYEKETSIPGIQLQDGRKATPRCLPGVCRLGGEQHPGDAELGSQTCAPQCHRWEAKQAEEGRAQ